MKKTEENQETKVNTEETVKSEEAKESEKIVDIEDAKKEEQEVKKDETPLEQATRERDEYLNSLQRLQAEFTNYRKRMVKDKEDFRKYALESFAQEVLLILDNFERALASADANHDIESLKQGITLIEKQFVEWLNTKNIKAIDSVGKEFDPNFHQAMTHQDSDQHPENTVLSEMQKGYMINDKILRPALVVVSKPAAKEDAEESKKED